MLNHLKELIKEIREKELEEFDWRKSTRMSWYFHEKYEEMLSKWMEETKKGNDELVYQIEEIFEQEIEIRKANGELARSKENNALCKLMLYKSKLNRLHYENDQLKLDSDESNCHCSLRQKHHLSPGDLKLLNKYGRVNAYYVEEGCIVYECERCSEKWLKNYVTELGMVMAWMKWNPRDSPLVEKFT